MRCDEGIVDSCGVCAGGHEGKPNEGSRVERNMACNVEVEIHAAKFIEKSIANNVGSLNILMIAGVVRKNVRIVL